MHFNIYKKNEFGLLTDAFFYEPHIPGCGWDP